MTADADVTGADPPARLDLEALRAQCIRDIVAAAPLLSGERRETVRALLNPGRPPMRLAPPSVPENDEAGPCTGPAIATTSPRPVSTRSGS